MFFILTNQMKELVTAYYTEAEWSNKNYVPSFDEYNNKVGHVTGGMTAYTTATLIEMGEEIVGKKEFEWLKIRAKIFKPAHVIARGRNDIVGHKVYAILFSIYSNCLNNCQKEFFDLLNTLLEKVRNIGSCQF